LKSKAKANIEFLGNIDDKSLQKVYSECEALIFPQVEDFGITTLESMASGRPVIAFNQGGAIDTIKNNVNGIFFDKQTPQDLIKAIETYQKNKNKFDSNIIKKHAQSFDQEEFENKLNQFIEEKWSKWSTGN
jgi:glycosyltransferase involved in cell wall biosynthesis